MGHTHAGENSKMAHSGVAVQHQVGTEFNNIKLKHIYSYVQMKITDDFKEIEVEKCVEPGVSYEEFVAQLPAKDCRYAVFDFKFSLGAAAGNREQLVFIVWCPDTASVKKKMLYSTSKLHLKKKLVGITNKVQATEPSELSLETVEEKVKSKAYT